MEVRKCTSEKVLLIVVTADTTDVFAGKVSEVSTEDELFVGCLMVVTGDTPDVVVSTWSVTT